MGFRIERGWSELVERPVVLSRRDWACISRWHSWGLPLELIEQALRYVVQSKPGREPRGLGELVPTIEESWNVILQGRIPPHSAEADPTAHDPRAAWDRRLGQEPPDSPLARTLTDLLAPLDDGDAPELLEEELDRRLPEVAPAELVDRVLAELERELSEYRSRIPAERLRATRALACSRRLRQALDLPRLAPIRTTE